MRRRDFLRCAGIAAAAALAPGSGGVPACLAGGQKDRPNIVFILIDDMGWKDVGFMGSTFYETPHIDKLAAEGMVFTSAYTCGPNCAPTRASLMSGQYTPRHGVITVGSSERGPAQRRKLIPVTNKTELSGDIVTLAEALKSSGYVCASMGKWHLGNDPQLGPIGQGFDVNVGGNIAGHPRSYFSPYRNKDLPDGPAGEYITDRLTDEAVRFIEQNKDRPFFLYLPHYAVHTPLQAKKQMIAKYRTKPPSGGQSNPTYAAMIESTDQGVGRIMAALDTLNLRDKTVVIFSSDNGGVGGYQALGIKSKDVTSNAPLRGGKGMLHEGGVRVPLAVRWPGVVRSGTRCETSVITVDFYPTLLAMAGAKAPTAQALDGESILGLLRETGGLERDAVYWHFPAYLEGGKGAWRTTPAGAIRRGPWKLIEFFEDGRLELYNLADDIGETKDLAETMPDKAAQLHALLKQWRRRVGASVPTRLNPQYDPDAR